MQACRKEKLEGSVIEAKKIVVFEKDQKARHIIDIMLRKMGASNISDVEQQEDFDQALAGAVDRYSGMAGLLGKAALPKLDLDLVILDWDTPRGGAVPLIKLIKSKYSGHYRFLLVADKKHFGEMSAALKAGATDFVLKPFTMAEFKEKLDNVLSDKPLTVQSFNIGAASDKSKKAGYGVNPFAVDKATPGGNPFAAAPAAAPAAAAKPARPAVATGVPPLPKVTPRFAAKDPAAPPKGGGGASFITASQGKILDKSQGPIATLIDGKINGHYHLKVDVIGGGENCFWATELPNAKVRLEYLSAKGAPTGIEAKVIDREEFMYSYYLCAEWGCSLLRRLGQWPPAGYDEEGNQIA